MDRITQLENLKFVQQMGALSEQTFKQVYQSNQDFVEFTRTSMSQGAGIFKFWLEYVNLRSKPTHA